MNNSMINEPNSHIQTKILETILLKQEKIPESPHIGITAAGIGKYVTRGTFQINRKKMMKKGLIVEVYSKDHGEQIWRYYDITLFGFLSLLKNSMKKTIRKDIHLQRFLPLIQRHWIDLKKIYPESVVNSFLNSCLSVSLNFSSIKEKPGKTATNGIREIVELKILGNEIILSRFHKMEKNNHVINYKILNKIKQSVTFLFYFSIFVQNIVVKHDRGIFVTQMFTGTTRRNKITKQVDTAFKSQMIKLNETIKIIKEDKDLNSIFQKYLKMIDEKFNKPKVIYFLEQKILF